MAVAYVLAFGGGQLPHMLGSSAASLWFYSELARDQLHDVADRGLLSLARRGLE